MAFDREAALDHGGDHLAAQILIMIGWRDWEIAFLVARPVTKIICFAARIPAPFLSIDEIKSAVLVLIEADIVEDVELSFSAEKGSIGHATILQVHFGLSCDPTRIAVVMLARDGVDYVAEHHHSARFGKRIHERGR